MHLRCIECHRAFPLWENRYRCSYCSDLLEVHLSDEDLSGSSKIEAWGKSKVYLWKYWPLLPPIPKDSIVSLGEGGTSLHHLRRLGEELGLRRLYAKNEGQNPTGSFKDRGMTVGVSLALSKGYRTLVCASTGNTSASLAAYSAKAGLRAIVMVPEAGVALGKMAQAAAYGAEILKVKGSFDEALRLILQLASEDPSVYLLNSVNPFRIEGQKTLAYEVVEQLGSVPDMVIMPVGNAANIAAAWKGFLELKEAGLAQELPRMVGVQAEGADPIARAFLEGGDVRYLSKPRTIASAIRIGAPVSWKKALRAIRDSKGLMVRVSDHEILEAQRSLASKEGLFVEPASATTLAALRRLTSMKEVDSREVFVLVATGHGLKDPASARAISRKPISLTPDISSLKRYLSSRASLKAS